MKRSKVHIRGPYRTRSDLPAEYQQFLLGIAAMELTTPDLVDCYSEGHRAEARKFAAIVLRRLESGERVQVASKRRRASASERYVERFKAKFYESNTTTRAAAYQHAAVPGGAARLRKAKAAVTQYERRRGARFSHLRDRPINDQK